MQLREAVSSHSDGSGYLLSAMSIIITLIQVLTHSKLLHSFIIVCLQLRKVHKLFSSILNRIELFFFFYLTPAVIIVLPSNQCFVDFLCGWVGVCTCVHTCEFIARNLHLTLFCLQNYTDMRPQAANHQLRTWKSRTGGCSTYCMNKSSWRRENYDAISQICPEKIMLLGFTMFLYSLLM